MRLAALYALSLALAALSAMAGLGAASYLTFQVEPKAVQCFNEDLAAGAQFDMSFEVTRGGLLDIKFQLYDPNRNLMQERMAFFNKPVCHCCHCFCYSCLWQLKLSPIMLTHMHFLRG